MGKIKTFTRLLREGRWYELAYSLARNFPNAFYRLKLDGALLRYVRSGCDFICLSSHGVGFGLVSFLEKMGIRKVYVAHDDYVGFLISLLQAVFIIAKKKDGGKICYDQHRIDYDQIMGKYHNLNLPYLSSMFTFPIPFVLQVRDPITQLKAIINDKGQMECNDADINWSREEIESLVSKRCCFNQYYNLLGSNENTSVPNIDLTVRSCLSQRNKEIFHCYCLVNTLFEAYKHLLPNRVGGGGRNIDY